jgi:thiol-disulfide isomerase/thioredoxin
MMPKSLLSWLKKSAEKCQKFFTLRGMAFVMAAGFYPLGVISAKEAGLDFTPYRGQVVYLDFWASWCGPCKQSFPWMARMQSLYGQKGFAVIAVNVDRDRVRADAFLAQNGRGFKVVYDPKGELAAEYKIKGMPSAVLIGRDGRTRYSHTGFFVSGISGYEAQILELVNEK